MRCIYFILLDTPVKFYFQDSLPSTTSFLILSLRIIQLLRMLNRGLLGVTIASLVLLASFSTIMMKASCTVLQDSANENVTSTVTSDNTVSSITDNNIIQDVSTNNNNTNKRFESLDEKVPLIESKKVVAEPIKPTRPKERTEQPCPARVDPFTTPLDGTSSKKPRPNISVEIRELLKRINLDESDLPDEVLLELNDRQIRRDLEQSSFNLDPFMEWLTLTPEPGLPSRLSRMVNGEADEYGEDDWLKMFERKGEGFKELRSKKNRPILDEFFYYELSKRVFSGQGTAEHTPLRKMVEAIRAARKMYLWGTCYLIWSQRESLVMLPHAIGFTASAMCIVWAIMLVMFMCWCMWREAKADIVSLTNSDTVLGSTTPSWSFLLGTLTGWEYLFGMAKYCLWGTIRPSLERAMRRHQPTRWWDMFYSAPQVGDWSDLEDEDDKNRGGKDGRRRKQVSSFTSSRRNSPSSLGSGSSEESEEEQQDPLALESILQGRKKSINKPVTRPTPHITRVPTPPQQAQQQPQQRQHTSDFGKVPFVKHKDTFKKTFVPHASIPYSSASQRPTTYSKPAVPDAPFKPAMSFADAMVGAKLSAPSSTAPSGTSSPPPGMSSRASSTRRRSRLLPFITEEDAQNNVDDGVASPRSLRSSSSSATLNSEFMSGFTSPSFSLFSNNMVGVHQPASASTDTPADNLLMDAILRRGRQQSFEEERQEKDESASDSEVTYASRFLKNKNNRPL